MHDKIKRLQNKVLKCCRETFQKSKNNKRFCITNLSFVHPYSYGASVEISYIYINPYTGLPDQYQTSETTSEGRRFNSTMRPSYF